MMRNTKKAVTVHGEVEYETFRCDSCGDEYMVEDAISIGIGLKKTRIPVQSATEARDMMRQNTSVFGFKRDDGLPGVMARTAIETREGELKHVCPYCAEAIFDYDGPTTGVRPKDFLRSTWRQLRPEDQAKCIGAAAGVALGLILLIGYAIL